MAMDKALEREVWQRSEGVCEYCHLPQISHRFPFQIDHITAAQHGGMLAVLQLLGRVPGKRQRHDGGEAVGRDIHLGFGRHPQIIRIHA